MNTTTLNMTTLDGGIIIKRGESGGATINNQDKVVDITENGTTEVVADGGYTGLGKVTINTEVSEGGGSNLSPDAIVYEPNGWYWKWVEGMPSDFNSAAMILLSITHDLGANYYEGLLTDTTAPDADVSKSTSIFFLGANIRTMQNNTDNRGVCVIAVAESKYCSVKIDDTTTLTGNSMYEILNQVQPMTEVEFDSLMQTNMGLKRITKEEYEALITK